MIDTDLKFLQKELEEELCFFKNGENLNIRHLFSQREDRVVNTVVINGKAYAYGNLFKKTGDEIVDKRLVKRYAKLSLYKAVSAFTGEVLPWGALTGVRPTKLAYQRLDECGEFKEFFTDTMKVSLEKTLLTEKIIDAQKGFYEKNPDNTDFFVFIPFCPSRCKYCSFISSDVKSVSGLVDGYVDALVDEIKFSAKFVKKLRSIYIGGGTPVVLSDKNLEKVLSAIDGINCGVEYTVEAGRPDCITDEKIKILLNHGVNRVCVNPQTFSDETLKLIGRNHTKDDILRAYGSVQGKFTVNMDLIAGLEKENFATFKNTVDTALSLRPENITVHSLCVKRGSYLSEETEKIEPGEIEKMIDYSENVLSESGYNPYYLYRQKYMAGNLENVGFSVKGKECVFNIDTMEEIADCVACGANGISKTVNFSGEKIERYGSPKDVKTYLAKTELIKKDKEGFFCK